MVDVEIRPVIKKDLNSLLLLYAQPEVGDGKVVTPEKAEMLLARIRNYPDYKLYVALYKEEIVGTMALLIMDNIFQKGRPAGIIEAVCVKSNWQGLGIDWKLIEFATRRCREAGCYKLTLCTTRVSKGLHRYYEKRGFKKQGFSYSLEL